MSFEAAPYQPLPPASGRAVAALVVGLIGLVSCCHLLGPVALFLAVRERAAIHAGLSSARGDGYAVAGLILGIIETVFLIVDVIVFLVWLFLLGGLALIAAGNAS
jgi:hypothetical protein